MALRCRQCSAPIDDLNFPCSGCGVILDDQTIEVYDESGRPPPADIAPTKGETSELLLLLIALTLLAAAATVGIYIDLWGWGREGGMRPMDGILTLGFRLGATAVPGMITAALACYSVKLALDLRRAGDDIQKPEA